MNRHHFEQVIKDKPTIILFDGVCNLCNSFINFLIDNDKKKVFYFAALQSEFGQHFRKTYRFSPNDHELESVVLLTGNTFYTYSSAVLEIAWRMGFPWNLLYGFRILPGPARNYLYKVVARNRYKWFGKKEQCRVPTPELKSRFIQ